MTLSPHRTRTHALDHRVSPDPAAKRVPVQPSAATQARGRRRTGSRDPFFDNAKLVLVTLVVVGHTWTLLPDAPSSSPVYHFLYSFHVPAFVLVTGYLSRSFSYSRRNLTRLFTTVVVPYFVFESLLALFRGAVGGEDLGRLYLDPHWPMWYLTALFLWRLATPVLLRIPYPMAFAVVVCLAGGVTTGDTLDTARAMGLLPFFVLGLTMRREQFERLAAPRVRRLALGALAIGFVAAVFLAEPTSKEWLYWRASYGELGVPAPVGMLVRLGLLVVAGVLALSVLALVPRTQRWFTSLGAASLVVYLCHGFFVKAALYAGVGGWAAGDPVTAFVVLSAAAVLLSLALAATPVSRRLNVLVDPISVAAADIPGIVAPDHQRVTLQRRLAPTHPHLTRPL
jgi:fucose 4-O-acetylase-like acetyltransferase